MLWLEGAPVQLRNQHPSVDLHHERAIEDLRPAADEAGLADRNRPGRTQEGSAGTVGGHRRYVSLVKRADPTGGRRVAQSAPRFSGSARPARASEPGRTRFADGESENLQPLTS